MGKNPSEEQLSQLTAHLRFDSFSKNEAVNAEIGKELGFMNNSGNFIRKGNNPTLSLSLSRVRSTHSRMNETQVRQVIGRTTSRPN